MFRAATSLPGQPIFGNVVSVSPSNEIVVVAEDVVHVVNGDALMYHSDAMQRQHRGSLKLPEVEKTKEVDEQPLGLKPIKFDNALWVSNSKLAVAGFVDGDMSLETLAVPEDVLATSLDQMVDVAALLPDIWHMIPMLPVDGQQLRPLVDDYPSPFALVEGQARRPLAGDGRVIALGMGRLVVLLEDDKPLVALEASSEISAIAVSKTFVGGGCVDGEIICWSLPDYSRTIVLPPSGCPVNLISLAQNSSAVYATVGNSLCLLVGSTRLSTVDIDHHFLKHKIIGMTCLLGDVIAVGLSSGKVILLKVDLTSRSVSISSVASVEGSLLGLTASVNRLSLITLASRRVDKQERLEVCISPCLVPDSLTTALVDAITNRRSLVDVYSALAVSSEKAMDASQYDLIERDDLMKMLNSSLKRLGVPDEVGAIELNKDQLLTAIIGMHYMYWAAYKLKASPGDSSLLAGEADERKLLFSEILEKMESNACEVCQSEVTIQADSRVGLCTFGHRIPICHNTFKPIVYDHCLRCPLCDSFYIEASIDEGRVCPVCNGCRLVSLT